MFKSTPFEDLKIFFFTKTVAYATGEKEKILLKGRFSVDFYAGYIMLELP
jgi:hypothetical protein